MCSLRRALQPVDWARHAEARYPPQQATCLKQRIAAFEDKDRKDKKSKKDGKVKQDKMEHAAEQFLPPPIPAAADEAERSKTRTPASERGMLLDVEEVQGVIRPEQLVHHQVRGLRAPLTWKLAKSKSCHSWLLRSNIRFRSSCGTTWGKH